MIKASELKLQRRGSMQKELADIEARLVKMNLAGYTSYQWDVPGRLNDTDVRDIAAVLAEAGFKVKHSRGSDVRGECWNFLNIVWN